MELILVVVHCPRLLGLSEQSRNVNHAAALHRLVIQLQKQACFVCDTLQLWKHVQQLLMSKKVPLRC